MTKYSYRQKVAALILARDAIDSAHDVIKHMDPKHTNHHATVHCNCFMAEHRKVIQNILKNYQYRMNSQVRRMKLRSKSRPLT